MIARRRGKALLREDKEVCRDGQKCFQKMMVEFCVMRSEFPGKQRHRACMELGELKVICGAFRKVD